MSATAVRTEHAPRGRVWLYAIAFVMLLVAGWLLLGMAHAVRVEEKENGIRTCVVCPGLVDTEILENRPVKPSAETLSKALKPGDVAEVILGLAKLPARVVVPELQVLPTYL